MPTKLSDIEIQNKLKDIETKIRVRKNFTRTDIQNALDKIKGKGLSPDSKIEILKKMIDRTGVKDIGIRTLIKPRDEVEEEDKTYAFTKDIFSYHGVIEKEK